MAFRKDLLLISSWIKPNTKVLDLGSGNGELLKILKQDKNINESKPLTQNNNDLNYKSKFPNDIKMLNLNNWKNYEQKEPNVFSAMYQFWLQKN